MPSWVTKSSPLKHKNRASKGASHDSLLFSISFFFSFLCGSLLFQMHSNNVSLCFIPSLLLPSFYIPFLRYFINSQNLIHSQDAHDAQHSRLVCFRAEAFQLVRPNSKHPNLDVSSGSALPTAINSIMSQPATPVP